MLNQDCTLVVVAKASTGGESRHRENLLRAETSRIGRIYHSQQIEKKGKISFSLIFMTK